MSDKSMDLIRDAYSKAIVQCIEIGNFTHSKLLIDNLEKLSSDLQTINFVPVVDNASSDLSIMPSLFDDDLENSSSPLDSSISNDTMRNFIISYVNNYGISKAEEVADSFEMQYGKQFNASDLSVTSRNPYPRWRKRLFTEAAKLRMDGVLMPHEYPYCYKYAFTQAYLNGTNEISVNF